MPTKKGTKRKAVRKGGYYSFSGDVGTAGAAYWTKHSEMGSYSISNRGGNTHYGRGRKRKNKKGGKTRKTMRGGGSYGAVSSSYQGTGSRGIADAVGVSINKPGFATKGEFNYYGGKPGDGMPNFITTGSK